MELEDATTVLGDKYHKFHVRSGYGRRSRKRIGRDISPQYEYGGVIKHSPCSKWRGQQRRNVALSTSQIRQQKTIEEAIGGEKSCGRKRLNESRPCGEARQGRRFMISRKAPNRTGAWAGIGEVNLTPRAPALCSAPQSLGLRDTEIMPPPNSDPVRPDRSLRGKVHRAVYSDFLNTSIMVMKARLVPYHHFFV